MSTLLEQASLVMIPSGYKEDVVYSQIPTSGAGDLSFTRASNGTRINSAGLVEVTPWNLAQYSEEFNNAIYTVKNAITIVDNSTTAPNGTTTAELIYPNSSGNFRYAAQIFTQSSNIYTTSIYAKAQNKSVIWMYMDDSSTYGIVYFDLSDGTMSVTAGSSSTPVGTMTAVGNGWYRCTFTTGTSIPLASGSGFGVCDAKGSPYATASGTNGVYFWGYQLNIGSTAKPYFPTTDRLNVPRLTYQNGGGGCPSLLLEKQSTNYATNSEDFTQWGPTAGTITLNAGTSPDGTNNANLFTEDTTTGYHRFSNSCTGLTGTEKTFSIFAKWAGGTGREWLTIDNGPIAYFDLKNGVVGTVQGTGTGTMEAMGNGWYRCIYTNSNSSSSTMYVGTANANNGLGNHLGNGQPAYYCWGAQAE